jgi:predicted dehydrogenase
VNPAFNYDGLHLRRFFDRTRLDEPSDAHDPYQFAAEADHFSKCILNGTEPQSPGEEGLRDLRYITQIYRSAGARA